MNLVRFNADLTGLLELGRVTLHHDGQGTFRASFMPRHVVLVPMSTSIPFDSIEEAVHALSVTVNRYS